MGKIMYNTYESVESSLNNMKTAVLDLDDVDGELNNIKFDNPEFGNIQVALDNAKKAVKSNVQAIKSNIENDVSIALNAKSEFLIFESKSNEFLDTDFSIDVTFESIKPTIMSKNLTSMTPIDAINFMDSEDGDVIESVNQGNIGPNVVGSTVLEESEKTTPLITEEIKEFEQNSASDSLYIVKEGDSLAKIAVMSGVSLSSLIAANPQIKDPNLILVGDNVNIPNVKENNEHKTDSEFNSEESTSTNLDMADKNNNDSRTDTNNININNSNNSLKTDSSMPINYRTKSVDGNRTVAGNSGYSVNEVMSKIKDECEKQKIGEHWVDVCAISLWETGTYTSDPFINNNVGGMCHSDGVTTYSFSSIDEGITSYVSNLKNNYYDQGLTTIDSIASKYCPPNPTYWTDNVSIMKNQIERCL